jgi:hypothetical protein
MVGNDVAVLQLNLDLTVDGDFGDKTFEAVKSWQEKYNLDPVDGIAGPDTQRSIVVQLSRPATRLHNLPAGILKSIVSNESGFILAAAGPHSGDSGWDVGAFMRSSGATPPNTNQTRSFFNVKKSAEWTANHLATTKSELGVPVDSRYLSEIGKGNKEEFAWMLAILAHNWPYAADNIARWGHIFVDADDDDFPANWIVIASGGRLSTPRQWVTSYIEKATGFVKWESI